MEALVDLETVIRISVSVRLAILVLIVQYVSFFFWYMLLYSVSIPCMTLQVILALKILA